MKKHENFCAALDNMKEIFNYDAPYDHVVLTGLVGLFEICFEQAWKMMKEILFEHGYAQAASGSPKQILKLAYESGLIEDEVLWLSALKSRNNVAHSYNELVALEIVAGAKAEYYEMFRQLKAEIEQSWMQ